MLSPSPSLSGVQTSQPVHSWGAGDDGEPLRCSLFLPNAASQSGPLPQRRRASANESHAQVRLQQWHSLQGYLNVEVEHFQQPVYCVSAFASFQSSSLPVFGTLQHFFSTQPVEKGETGSKNIGALHGVPLVCACASLCMIPTDLLIRSLPIQALSTRWCSVAAELS